LLTLSHPTLNVLFILTPIFFLLMILQNCGRLI
jgi:hypothetical protein